MAHEISQREVLNNLIRFKDSLLERRGGQEPDRRGTRTYQVLLHCKTGEMRFAKKINTLEHNIGRKSVRKEVAGDWKEIQMLVKEGPLHFEVASLKPSDIASVAWVVLSETLNVLNQKAEHIQGNKRGMLPEEAVLCDLSSIHMAVGKDRIEDLPGWMHAIGRVEAERMLDGKPEGTYVLREGDELTLSISFHFEEENLLKIHPYLVTVVEKEEKISDILLLQTSKGWLLYHDDPNLEDKAIYQYFPTPQVALAQLKDTVKSPLVSPFPVKRASDQK